MGKRGNFRARRRLFRLLAKEQEVCWLGLEPLDFSVTDPRDMRHVEIDEEIPASLGGATLDPANCNLVCRYHNLKKGNRVVPRGHFAEDACGAYGMRRRKTRTSREW